MKVIDLLDRIAAKDAIPTAFKLFDETFELEDGKYVDSEGYDLDDYCLVESLNEELGQTWWRIKGENISHIEIQTTNYTRGDNYETTDN